VHAVFPCLNIAFNGSPGLPEAVLRAAWPTPSSSDTTHAVSLNCLTESGSSPRIAAQKCSFGVDGPSLGWTSWSAFLLRGALQPRHMLSQYIAEVVYRHFRNQCTVFCYI
jgi:hypothetical protein